MTQKYVLGPDIDLDKEVVLDGDGRRITEARARQIAEETMAVVRAGRPSLTRPGTHSPEVRARVPAELNDRLKAQARDRGTTPSALIREALERYLAS